MSESAVIRTQLLAEIRRRRGEFEAAGSLAEQRRNLPADTIATLRWLGAFWLKTPAELGGTPLDPLDFCDVLEEFAYTDSAVGWAVMVGNGGTGTAGGWLPDAGARYVFGADKRRPLVVGTPGPRGTGRPVAGGYLVSGRWSFASGCDHADWLIGGFRETGDGQLMVAIVPRESAEIIDNWRVAGLRGSGSFDFRLDEVFVPASLTFERAASACRGGALFNVEAHVFLSNELPPLMVGMARRALAEMSRLAGQTARFPSGPVLAERAVFREDLGRAEASVRAARAVHRDAVASTWEVARSGRQPAASDHIALTTASVFAAETCTDVIGGLFRYGGARLLADSQLMQRLLRDMLAARQHIGLSEEVYERAGRERVESRAIKNVRN